MLFSEFLRISFLCYIPVMFIGTFILVEECICYLLTETVSFIRADFQKIDNEDKESTRQNIQISKEDMELFRQSTQASKEDTYKIGNYNTNSILTEPLFGALRYNYFLNRAEFWDGKEWREMK